MKQVLATIAVIAAIATLCRAFYKKGYKEGCKYAFQQMAAYRQYQDEERRNSHFKKKHSKSNKSEKQAV